jgi:hypothetical protein
VQSLRIRDLKRRTSADMWEGLRTIRSMVGHLEKTKKIAIDLEITSAYTSATGLFRHLLKQVILEEHDFSESTIAKWRSAGKLESPWQENVARYFLETKNIRNPNKNSSAQEKDYRLESERQ